MIIPPKEYLSLKPIVSHYNRLRYCFTFPDAFHKQAIEIDLVLACIGELNTIVRNGVHWPILYGAGKLDIFCI